MDSVFSMRATKLLISRMTLALVGGFCLGLLVGVAFLRPTVQTNTAEPRSGTQDSQAERALRRLYGWEQDYLLRADVPALQRFLPDDFIAINQANLLLTKPQVIDRLRKGIGRYRNYGREFDYFRRYGGVMVVVGTESIATAPDAARPDAGQATRRRFTELWAHREGTWEKIVRHASHVAPE